MNFFFWLVLLRRNFRMKFDLDEGEKAAIGVFLGGTSVFYT